MQSDKERKFDCCLCGWLDYKLEIYFTMFFIAKHMSVPLTQLYVENTVFSQTKNMIDGCETNVSFSNASNTNMMNATVSELVSQATYKIMEIGIVELILSVPVVLLFGFMSDAYGKRKPLLWLPSIGLAIYSLGLILEQYFPTQNFIGIYIGAAVHGLTGNMVGFIVGVNAYISDNISLKWRTLRLVIFEILMNIALGVGNIIAGIWVDSKGFGQPMWFIFALSVLTAMLILFTLEETDVPYEDTGKMDVNNLKQCAKLFSCGKLQNRRLWIVFISYQIFSIVHQGTERTRILFLTNSPLCFSSYDIGLFVFALAMLGALGTSLCLLPLAKMVTPDNFLALLGLMSTLAGTILFACSSEKWQLYLSAGIMVFHALPYPVKRSISSKQVSDEMQGSLYALLMGGQALTMFLGPLIFNAVYASTLKIYNGFVFILAGCLLIIPLLLMSYVAFIDFTNRQSEYHDMDTTLTDRSGNTSTQESDNSLSATHWKTLDHIRERTE